MRRRRLRPHKPIKKLPSHRLKYIMQSKGIKQRTVAMVTGISISKINRYLNGYKYIPQWIEKRIEDAIYLLSEDTPKVEKQEIRERLFPHVFD